MPRFDARSWRLRIDGLVAEPRELGYEELRRLPRVEQTSERLILGAPRPSAVGWATG